MQNWCTSCFRSELMNWAFRLRSELTELARTCTRTKQHAWICNNTSILFNNIRKPAWREWIDSIFSTTLENGLLSQRPSFCQNKTIICNDFETLLPNSTTQETLPPVVMGKLYLKTPFTWAWSKAFLASSILYLERAAMYMDGTKNMIDWPWNARNWKI